MKYAYAGIHKFISHKDRLYFICDATIDAATQAEFAEDVLKRDNETFNNNRSSHEAARQILVKAESTLANYLVLTA